MKAKRQHIEFPMVRPIPVTEVLGRIDEILREKDVFAACHLYVAEVGVILQFQSTSRILSSAALRNLIKLAELIDGELYVSPSKNDVSGPEAKSSYRVMEIVIRTNHPVTVTKEMA